MNLLEQLDQIPEKTKQILDVSSNHPFTCRCDTCLSWWAECGPDGGEPGQYGPFTKDEVNGRQRELNIPVTP